MTVGNDSTPAGGELDVDTIYRMPPGYSAAVQWLLVGVSTAQELLESSRSRHAWWRRCAARRCTAAR